MHELDGFLHRVEGLVVVPELVHFELSHRVVETRQLLERPPLSVEHDDGFDDIRLLVQVVHLLQVVCSEDETLFLAAQGCMGANT